MQPSATLAMSARARARKAAGHPVISLSAGEPDFDTPGEIAEAAIQAIRDGFTHYTDNKGTLELREAVCAKLLRDNGLEYSADQIVCSNGAKQSVAQAVSVLCGPGDEVVVPAPYWVSYPEMVRFAGADPVVAPTGVDEEYLLSPEKLEAALSPRTRLLILCSPSNPTGSVYSREQMSELVDVLRRYPDVVVLSDEIYEQIVYDARHVSIATFDGMKERTVTVGGFSKAYAMTGWRLGYLAAEPAIVGAVSKLQSQFTSGPSSISQKAGTAALKMSPEPVREMVSAFRTRRDAMLGALLEIDGLRCPVPDGAFYLFPDVTPYLGARTPDGDLIEDTEDLCVYILEHHDVALVPGHAFGGPTGVRLSYAASMDDLTEAGRRLQRAFASLDRG
ncbi:MAG: pyridoxal phosphate-dependent aminotransferase [Rhodothermales bacterium]|nr:pyridoxal phosphate-dependent aminotransferase [Rhodothermales bacterium]